MNDDFNAQNNLSVIAPGFIRSNRFAQAFPFPQNGQYACQVSGRITYSGNVIVTVYTEPPSSSVYGLITFNISDPTNNRNDCEVANDVILDGSLTLTFSGNSSDGVGMSISGTIDVNNRGSGGGLVPRGSCFVNLTLPRGGNQITGSICGRSVS